MFQTMWLYRQVYVLLGVSWRRERKALGMEGKETTRVPGKQDLHRRQRMPDETGLKRRTFSIIRRR